MEQMMKQLETAERLLIHINRQNSSEIENILILASKRGYLTAVCCADAAVKTMWLSQIPKSNPQYDILVPIAKDTRVPIWLAIHLKKLDIIQLMFKHGFSVCDYKSINHTIYGWNQKSLLLEAAASGSVHIMKLLLEQDKVKEDLNLPDKLRRTPLMVAITKTKFDMVRYLLEEGCDPETIDGFGSTPLTLLIRECSTCTNLRNLQIIDLLIKKGASVNTPDAQTGKTPLHIALDSMDGNNVINVCELLFKHGANSNAQDLLGKTALHLACGHADTKRNPQAICRLTEMLLEYSCNPNIVDNDYNTALHLAVKMAIPKLVELLLQHGADDTLRNIDGLKPHELCSQRLKPILQDIFLHPNKLRVAAMTQIKGDYSDSEYDGVDGIVNIQCKSVSSELETAIDSLENKIQKLQSVSDDTTFKKNDFTTDFSELRRLVRQKTNVSRVTQRPMSTDTLFFQACRIVATRIGYEWKGLFRELLSADPMKTEIVISELDVRYQGQLREQAYQALLAWQHNSGRGANIARLTNALTTCQLTSIVEDIQDLNLT